MAIPPTHPTSSCQEEYLEWLLDLKTYIDALRGRSPCPVEGTQPPIEHGVNKTNTH